MSPSRFLTLEHGQAVFDLLEAMGFSEWDRLDDIVLTKVSENHAQLTIRLSKMPRREE